MKHGSWLALIGMLTLTGGCDSGKSFDGGTGNGAQGSGGDAATGGTSSGTGATGNGDGGTGNGEGGNGEGGSSMGGDGGDGGAGGAGDGVCPSIAPVQGADCEGLEGEGCTYEDSGCFCPTEGANAGTWQCGGAGVTDECEDDEPASGACSPGDSCTHSEGSGFCICAAQTWNCPGN